MFDFRRKYLLSRAVGLCVFGALFTPVLAFSASVGESAPNFSLPSTSGEITDLVAFRNRVVFLNFWASWCEPCKKELPELEMLHRKYSRHGFDVVGINIDKKEENAREYIERFALSFPMMLDPDGRVIRQYRGAAMPVSYLIDRQGVVRNVFFGYSESRLPKMEAAIMSLMNRPKFQ